MLTAGTRMIDFSCPGCGAEYHEPPGAAGKKTRCPRCETEFAIPADLPVRQATAARKKTGPPASPGRTAPRQRSGPPAPESPPPAPPVSDEPTQRRIISRATIFPIGFLLLTVGGLLTVVGTILTVRGYQQSLFGQFGALGTSLGASGDPTAPMQEYAKLLRELSQEPGQRPEQVDGQLPNPGPPPGGELQFPPATAAGGQTGGGGTALLYGGIIVGVLGSILSFVGGIFVFAGLIARLKYDEPVRLSYSAPAGNGTTVPS
jgi:hypothetical protein